MMYVGEIEVEKKWNVLCIKSQLIRQGSKLEKKGIKEYKNACVFMCVRTLSIGWESVLLKLKGSTSAW